MGTGNDLAKRWGCRISTSRRLRFHAEEKHRLRIRPAGRQRAADRRLSAQWRLFHWIDGRQIQSSHSHEDAVRSAKQPRPRHLLNDLLNDTCWHLYQIISKLLVFIVLFSFTEYIFFVTFRGAQRAGKGGGGHHKKQKIRLIKNRTENRFERRKRNNNTKNLSKSFSYSLNNKK